MTSSSIDNSLGALSMVIAFVAYVPYFHSIIKGRTKPHLITWIIWTIVTCAVFLAQFMSNGGAGTWATGFSGILAVVVVVLSIWKESEYRISFIDWLCLAITILSIVLWIVIKNPFYTVLILTVIDLIGYIPTVRKAYNFPFEEHAGLFVITTIRNIIALMALAEFSFINVVFLLATGVGNIILIALIYIRRHYFLVKYPTKFI